MKSFLLKIVTPEREFYSGEIEYLMIDTPDGKVGLMSGASPRILLLAAGEIVVKTSVLETRMYSGDGIASVTADGVIIVTDSCTFDGKTEAADKRAGDGGEYKRLRAKLASSVVGMKDGGHREI